MFSLSSGESFDFDLCISFQLRVVCLVDQVMLDTVGPELQVINKSEKAITLKADGLVTLTPNQDREASSEVLPINFDGLAKVRYII